MPEEHIMAQKTEGELALRRRVPREVRLYGETFVLSLFLLFISGAYVLLTGSSWGIKTLNRVLADLSFILLGMSLGMSSVCYFWNFADRLVIYRKHVGIVGVVYLLLHGAISLSYAGKTPILTYFLSDANRVAFLAAVAATVIFLIMTAISNRFSIQHIGPKQWRIIMRIGFLGYILGMIHAGIKASPGWIGWFAGDGSFAPPFGLIVFCFGVAVIVLRIALEIALPKPRPSHQS